MGAKEESKRAMKTTPTFLFVFGLCLLLWSGIFYAGSYLAHEPERVHGGQNTKNATTAEALKQKIVSLQKKRTAEPENPRAHSDLGYALLNHGVLTGDGSELIAALKEFDAALALDPKHPPALLGLASVSLRVGVYQKAETFYRRYLELEADDLRALSDYAIALMQLGKYDEAQSALEKALVVDSNAVPVLMVYAMLERGRGNVPSAVAFAKRALASADDDTSVARIEAFLGDVERTPPGKGSASALAKEFFGQHPIIGPKFRGVRSEDRVVYVDVEDFPVEAMPAVAKESLNEKIFLQFKQFSASVDTIIISDSTSGEALLSFPLMKPQ